MTKATDYRPLSHAEMQTAMLRGRQERSREVIRFIKGTVNWISKPFAAENLSKEAVAA